MTPLAEILRDEIRRTGPISFHRFMDAALYHPEFGYYRRPRDPFGMQGDFYTAEQLQPVFGTLMASLIRGLREEMGAPDDFTVVELGAGRSEMADAFRDFRYIPLDLESARLPEGFRGVIFSNEFFDALPVEVAVVREQAARELRVGIDGDRFHWVEAGRSAEEIQCYRKKYLSTSSEGQLIEINLEALRWMDRIAGALNTGYVVTIDYGYTAGELPRFSGGTLMSYRRHQAIEDVLSEPGSQDITAHVCFTALDEYGASRGLAKEFFEPLERTLMRAGEEDHFAAALGADSAADELRRRLQLKQLLFGMGQTFRTLIQRKAGSK